MQANFAAATVAGLEDALNNQATLVSRLTAECQSLTQRLEANNLTHKYIFLLCFRPRARLCNVHACILSVIGDFFNSVAIQLVLIVKCRLVHRFRLGLTICSILTIGCKTI